MNIFKKAVSALTAAAVMATAAASLSTNVFTADAAMSAVELVEDMGLGWNLGNALDSVNTWDNPLTPEKSETGWGNPVTTKAMITEIEKTGFNTVRIPVTWSQWTDGSGNIDTTWLARVKEVVDYVVSSDMYAIIDIHHDGSDGVEDNWLTGGTSQQAKYTAMWKQISNYFADYGQELVFESMNEVKISDDQINTLNQAFVDTVRATGGNNANRLLLVPAYDNNTAKLLSSAFQLPTDSANMIAVSCHYYEPPTFCVAELDSTWGYDADWGTNTDMTTAKSDFDALKSKFVDNGVPVIIGEYGVVTNEGKDTQSIYNFLKYVASTTYNMEGICPVVWDDGDSGSIELFERSTLKWYDANIQNIFKEVAAGGTIDKNLTDRITMTAAEMETVNAETGATELVIDLKPYKEMGLNATTVVVDYSLTSAKNSAEFSGGLVTSFNVVNANGETQWCFLQNSVGGADTSSTFEIPQEEHTYTINEEEGQYVTGTFDMDYLKFENWWTWSAATGDTVTLDIKSATVIFDNEFYTDDVPDVTETTPAETTTTTAEPVTTTQPADTTTESGEDTTATTTGTTEAVDPSEVVGNVWLAGQAGGVGFWAADDAGQVPAAITGNGQYTASWEVQSDGTDNIECLILQSDFNIYAYAPEGTTDPLNECSVKLTVDKVTLDGVEVEYTGPTDGCVTTGDDGVSMRVNILNTWGNANIKDIVGSGVSLTDVMEVTFTVSGLPEDPDVSETETTTSTTPAESSVTTTTETVTSTEPVDPAEVVGNVWLAGQAGGVGFWAADDAGQVPAAITGNGQYTAS
ncbi:MAG: glycoside hydrolase family 5 protein, partial [Ruminococcus sp.]|nr:glycoside hydrolase family 5 protein [Ruminococcus sp.]